ncbi:MAG: hypothetical protein LN413_05450 [Candidatus Thermoplasmatota archaeon]|nr:hypothetical protein [Candidatus Thermoplasmatota archaeon]
MLDLERLLGLRRELRKDDALGDEKGEEVTGRLVSGTAEHMLCRDVQRAEDLLLESQAHLPRLLFGAELHAFQQGLQRDESRPLARGQWQMPEGG